MIDPQKCAERIIRNEPELAEQLLDLLVWAARQPNLEDDNDYDEILGLLYAKLQHCREAREAYISGRAA